MYVHDLIYIHMYACKIAALPSTLIYTHSAVQEVYMWMFWNITQDRKFCFSLKWTPQKKHASSHSVSQREHRVSQVEMECPKLRRGVPKIDGVS